MSDPTKAPAGWYEDGSGGRRYWDGDAWTEYIVPGDAPTAGASDAAGSPDAATSPITPESTDAYGTAEYPTLPLAPNYGAGTPAASGYGAGIPAASGYGDSTTTSGWRDATIPFDTVDATGNTEAQPAMVLAPMHPFTERSNPRPNVLGVIALVVAAAGLVFACIPAALGVAWILLPVAFVLSFVGLFTSGAKWPAVTGLIVSIVAAIVGIVVFVNLVIGSVTDVFEQIDDVIPDAPVLPQPGEDAPGAEPEQPEAPDAGNLGFGETMVWDDGVALTVSAPESYTPSEFAVGATLANNVVFTMTITNNSSEDLQPVPFPQLSSGGQEASQIFDIGSDLADPGDDVGIPPVATIPPGGSVTWRVAWSVADPNALTMEAAPSFEYEDAVFTNVP